MSKTALYIHPCHPVTEKAGLEVIRGWFDVAHHKWLKGDIGGYLIDCVVSLSNHSLCSVDESWNCRRSLEVRYSLSLHDVLDRVLILNEGDDPHLCFTLALDLSSGRRWTLKWVDLIYALYAAGPTTLTKLDSTDFGELAEVTTAVALLLLGWRSDFSKDNTCNEQQ